MQNSMKQKNKVSILIPVYNNIRYTLLCIQAIEKNTSNDIDYQVIVIDDHSTEKIEDNLRGAVSGKIKEKLIILRNERNLGFAKSINRGAAESVGDILLFLNNDVFVNKRWLEPLISALDKGEGDIIGSKLLYPDGTIQHAGGVFYYERRQNTVLPYHLYRGFHSNFAGVNKRRRFNWVTFACVMMSRNVFEDLDGLDKTFLNSYEDVDFCLRAIEKGYVVLYEPSSIAYHIECGTRGYGNSQDEINHKKFIERHQSLSDDDFVYYIEDGVPIELGREFSVERFPVKIRD